jgi:hypothetical protein
MPAMCRKACGGTRVETGDLIVRMMVDYAGVWGTSGGLQRAVRIIKSGGKISPYYLHTNKLACYSFMEFGRRHRRLLA